MKDNDAAMPVAGPMIEDKELNVKVASTMQKPNTLSKFSLDELHSAKLPAMKALGMQDLKVSHSMGAGAKSAEPKLPGSGNGSLPKGVGASVASKGFSNLKEKMKQKMK